MTDLATTDRLFFERAGMDRDRINRLVDETLNDADDGELFLDVMASVYPGYDATSNFGDVIVGTLYGLVDGAVGGCGRRLGV